MSRRRMFCQKYLWVEETKIEQYKKVYKFNHNKLGLKSPNYWRNWWIWRKQNEKQKPMKINESNIKRREEGKNT